MNAVKGIFSVALSAIFLLAVGFLDIRSQAVQLGVSVDWQNSIKAVGQPATPWLPDFAVATTGVIAILYLLTSGDSRESNWLKLIFGSAVILTTGVVLALITSPYLGLFLPQEISQIGADAETIRISESNPILGWLIHGALHPVSHTIGLFAIVLPIIRRKPKSQKATT